MKTSDRINCALFPCTDVEKNSYSLPDIDIDSNKIKLLIVAEAPPDDAAEYFYAPGVPFFLQTVLQAFNDAGENVSCMQDILDLGVYITTAIKCAKTQYAISPDTIKNCATLLEQEIGLFPNVKAFIPGGDVAIKILNDIWKKQTGKRVIPAGSTYKIRKQEYYFEGKRVFPSYTPAGKNFLIEKAKRKMVAEDIRNALSWLKQ